MRGKWRVMRSAFTMIEVIVMIVILGILAVVIAPRVLQHVGKSKQSVAARPVAKARVGPSHSASATGGPVRRASPPSIGGCKSARAFGESGFSA